MYDSDRARRNREMVANKQSIGGYVRVELYLQTHPSILPLPDWIPTGDLPYLSESDLNTNQRELIETDD